MLKSTLFIKNFANISKKVAHRSIRAKKALGKIMEGHFMKVPFKQIVRPLAFSGFLLLGGVAILLVNGCGGNGEATPTTIVLTSYAALSTEVSLSWSGTLSGDQRFDVYKNDTYYNSTLNNTMPVTGLDPDKRYCFIVYKVDPAIGIVERSNISCTATLGASLAAKAVASRSVSLSPERRDDSTTWGRKTYPPDGWTLKAVERVGAGRICTVTGLDSAGRVHVLYNEPAPEGYRLKLAVLLGDLWTRDVIDANGDVESGVAMSIDGRDGIHVVYLDSSGSQLKYAKRTSETWLSETVDDAVSAGSNPCIQADWWGEVHISYLDAWDHALKYADKGPGGWRHSTVDWANMFGNGADVSMALDSQNRVHIGYYDSAGGPFPREEGMLKYATDADGVWQIQSIDRSPVLGGFPALALDSADKVHVAYFDAAGFALKYATNYLGRWDISTVERVGDGIGSISIAVDVADRVHIAYTDGMQQALKYATDASGEWTITILDRGVYAAGKVSIAADGMGRVHVAYVKGGYVKVLTN
jgi:hypothetical protein